MPKNLMHLADKLPSASYDIEGKIYKNKSETKFKLPQLNSSFEPSKNLSSAIIEY